MGLSRRFRRKDVWTRRAELAELLGMPIKHPFGTDEEMVERADVMVESAVGYLALPVGVATGFLIDGDRVDVPMATEEPSVIAAASYGAGIAARGGGIRTTAGATVTRGQLYLSGTGPDGVEKLTAARAEIEQTAAPVLESMKRRGGGLVDITVQWLDPPSVVRLEVLIDVRDAMGANLVNTVMETIRPIAERVTGGSRIMAILSNSAPERTVTADFSLPVRLLERAGWTGAEMGARCELASLIAEHDPNRAVTHNKGVMNGITAVALATGNDTRALEAAAHSWAARSGAYRPFSTYRCDGEQLHGHIEIPVVLGTVGGAAEIHPTAAAARQLLGSPSAARLACIAASVGLSQNLAAVMALVGEGIQPGHMGLHAERVAWLAGARGSEREAVVSILKERNEYSASAAREALEQIRRDG
jgi:hydroxymethylglutaryl-CoA reductase